MHHKESGQDAHEHKLRPWIAALCCFCLIIFNLFLYPAPAFAENQIFQGRILSDGQIYQGRFWQKIEGTPFNPCPEGMSFEGGICNTN